MTQVNTAQKNTDVLLKHKYSDQSGTLGDKNPEVFKKEEETLNEV